MTDLMNHTIRNSDDYHLNGIDRDCIIQHYKSGRQIEARGRHMRRQAVAAEFNSGRTMVAFARSVDTPVRTIRDLLNEARNFGLLNSDVATSPEDAAAFSEACPTQDDAREWARIPLETRQEMQAEVAKVAPNLKVTTAQDLVKKHREIRMGYDPNHPFRSPASCQRWERENGRDQTAVADAPTEVDATIADATARLMAIDEVRKLNKQVADLQDQLEELRAKALTETTRWAESVGKPVKESAKTGQPVIAVIAGRKIEITARYL